MKKTAKYALLAAAVIVMVMAFAGCGGKIQLEDVAGIWQVVDEEGSKTHAEQNEKGIYVFYMLNDDMSMEANIIVDGKIYPVREGIWELNKDETGFVINSGSGKDTGYSIKAMEDVPGTVDGKGGMSIEMDESTTVNLAKVDAEFVRSLIKK